MVREEELASFSSVKARLLSYHRHAGQIADASLGQEAAGGGKKGTSSSGSAPTLFPALGDFCARVSINRWGAFSPP